MTYLELSKTIKRAVFSRLDVEKFFPRESEQLIRVQLFRFARRGLIRSLKRGLYFFPDRLIDEFEAANLIYQPSYISLETALNYHGVIPDVPLGHVTSVSPVTTRRFKTPIGVYVYRKIKQELFWGYSEAPFRMAMPEKALLDFEQFNSKAVLSGLRIDWSKIDKNRYDFFRKRAFS